MRTDTHPNYNYNLFIFTYLLDIQRFKFYLVNNQIQKREVFEPPQVIPQGFEPWTHALEGRCSNPTELRNPFFADAKVLHLSNMTKF